MFNVTTFTESAALVGAGAAGLMRYCFSHTHKFVTTEKRGGSVSTIRYRSVADFLISMEGREEIIWYLTWESCHYLETTGESELAYQAKVFGYEDAVQAVLEGMKALGVTAYDTKQPTSVIFDRLKGIETQISDLPYKRDREICHALGVAEDMQSHAVIMQYSPIDDPGVIV